MRRLLEYVRTLVLIAGVLVGIQVPAFVDQYGKALLAHQREALAGLSQFQDDADKYFGGSLERLIQHYRNSPDAVFNAGGTSITRLAKRAQRLDQAVKRFQRTPFSPYIQTLFQPISAIRDEVIQHYSYTIVLNGSAIAVGLLTGLLLAFVLEISVAAIGWPVRRAIRRRRVETGEQGR